jgi:hypothetical protein
MQTTFHRNLNAKGKAWSFVQNGKATQAKSIFAQFVTVKQPSGKKFEQCLAGGKRGVFAWFKSDEVWADCTPDIPDHAVRIRFNPKHGQKFFQTEDGQRVDKMTHVWCTESGECYATI